MAAAVPLVIRGLAESSQKEPGAVRSRDFRNAAHAFNNTRSRSWTDAKACDAQETAPIVAVRAATAQAGRLAGEH